MKHLVFALALLITAPATSCRAQDQLNPATLLSSSFCTVKDTVIPIGVCNTSYSLSCAFIVGGLLIGLASGVHRTGFESGWVAGLVIGSWITGLVFLAKAVLCSIDQAYVRYDLKSAGYDIKPPAP